MTKTYPHYQVAADRITGEWLTVPEYVGEVSAGEWVAKQDTDDEHYDTYEEPIHDETGSATNDTETRFITVVWEE